MEPNFNLLDSFTDDSTAGEVKKTLDEAGLRLRAVGYGNSYLEAQRQAALDYLDEKYLCHPSQHVQRPAVAISARGAK